MASKYLVPSQNSHKYKAWGKETELWEMTTNIETQK